MMEHSLQMLWFPVQLNIFLVFKTIFLTKINQWRSEHFYMHSLARKKQLGFSSELPRLNTTAIGPRIAAAPMVRTYSFLAQV